ncbi:LacI family DNA-binding transcriptional regulator [Metabacillus sp. JX24]|uniref:LacI family DNA-binding transcriptional regulator n=1 Tax=Metabacillus sp. JX24 TaxID=3240759 RepID=UPI00350EBF2C
MPTILDIARLSGVSKSTVSRVLNSHPHVSAESVQKVNKAIRTLSYVRNSQAVNLRLQTTSTIGIIIPMLDHPYFSQVTGILSISCHEAGYKTAVYQTFFNREEEAEVYERLLHKEMDAVVVTYSTLTEQEILDIAGDRIVVVCNEQFNGDVYDVISVNEEKALFAAASYLLEQGRRNLVLCGDDFAYPLQQKRWKGFKRAHRNYGMPCTVSNRFKGMITIRDGIQLGEKLFQAGGKIDGILAGSDFVAAGLLRSAAAAGKSIPRDVSIIGFDNHQICSATTPPLSSISYSFEEMANTVMTCLSKRLRGEHASPAFYELEAELVIRGTTD